MKSLGKDVTQQQAESTFGIQDYTSMSEQQAVTQSITFKQWRRNMRIQMTNLTILTGRITKDLELKQAGQTQVTNFSAVDNPFKKDDTSFFDIVAFGKTCELLNNYCGKGSKILIEGNLKQDRFQDKERKQSLSGTSNC